MRNVPSSFPWQSILIIARQRKSPAQWAGLPRLVTKRPSYFLIPLVPLLLELGELLPDLEPAGPQSFIAVCDPLVPLELAPGLVDDPLALGLLEPELEPVVEPLVPPLELVEPDGLFIAEELPGQQSVLFIAPPVPVLVLAPGLVLVEPPVLLVCASAAVPSDRARIDAAARTRRFIRCPPCASEASPGTLPEEKPPACGDPFRSSRKVARYWTARHPHRSGKEKGPHRNAAQVQGGKARRTCNAHRRTGLAPHEKNRPEFLNKWLTW
jgi:hypothetical protein